MKLRANTDFALYPEAAAMRFDQVFGNGQAQPGSTGFAGTGSINAIKTLKDARLIGLRNADAGVSDGEDDFFVFGFGA